jgi:hypothetical protein
LRSHFFSGGHVVPGSHLVRHGCCRTAGPPPALAIPARMFGIVCCSSVFVCHRVALNILVARILAPGCSNRRVWGSVVCGAAPRPQLACAAVVGPLPLLSSVLVARILGGKSMGSRCWPGNCFARGRHQLAHVACPAAPASRHSATGTRTRVARVRAEYPNQLDYSGCCTVCLERPPSAADQRTSNLANRTRHAWATARAPEDQQVPRFRNR